jgi:hypothetical protein
LHLPTFLVSYHSRNLNRISRVGKPGALRVREIEF